MKLVVLGSGTSVPHPRRASAAFWLDTESGSVLLDCSADAPHRMAEEELDWPNLDAIWISHLHLDHCAGLASFLFATKWAPQTQARRKPLRIVGCEGVERLLTAIDESNNYGLFAQPFPVELYEIEPSETARPIEFSAVSTHKPFPRHIEQRVWASNSRIRAVRRLFTLPIPVIRKASLNLPAA